MTSLSNDEIIIDNFAGGGGTSTGAEEALGRPVDIAINHDPEAIAMHKANNPFTDHHCESVWDINPIEICKGRPVGLAWFSPDCKHFSKAKGDKPLEKNIRGLAWVAKRYAATVRPRIIILENVEEFKTWGPLHNQHTKGCKGNHPRNLNKASGEPIIWADGETTGCLPICRKGRPILKHKGRTFQIFKEKLNKHGYQVETNELVASHYGSPTSRKRFFLIARCDGQPIVWPEPSHGPGKKAYRTAAECIDWSLHCPSIFLTKEEGRKAGVKRPLAEKTLQRIAKGVVKYVINEPDPFIVPFVTDCANGSSQRNMSANEPLRTICAETKGGHFALVAAFLAKHYTGVTGSSLKDPLGTITTIDHHSLVTAFVSRDFGQSVGQKVTTPAPAIMPGGQGKTKVIASHIVKLRGTNIGHPCQVPLHTITAGGTHFGDVMAFLVKYYGKTASLNLKEPIHTITTKDRFGLVIVQGEPHVIAEIGMRMFQPRELFTAQGFPGHYIIDPIHNGKPLTKTAQVRMVGNSVPPQFAKALIEANYTAPSLEGSFFPHIEEGTGERALFQ